MNTKASGIVTEIRGRETKVGLMYDVVVNGISYGAGKYAPRGIAAGDYITFEYTENGQYKNINTRSIRKDDAPAPAAVSAAKAETRTVVAATDKRQETISKQANLNTATEIIKLQLEHGGLKFPANAKAPAVFEAIEGAVLELASRLYNLTTGETWDTAPVRKQAASSAAPSGDGDWPADEDFPQD